MSIEIGKIITRILINRTILLKCTNEAYLSTYWLEMWLAIRK